MDEQEFRRLLDLFPVVRSRHYHAESESSTQSTSNTKQNELREWQDAWNEGEYREVKNQGSDQHDAFWEKLISAAERKVDRATAEKFCKTFQQIHKKLVNKELSLGAARNFLNSPKNTP